MTNNETIFMIVTKNVKESKLLKQLPSLPSSPRYKTQSHLDMRVVASRAQRRDCESGGQAEGVGREIYLMEEYVHCD